MRFQKVFQMSPGCRLCGVSVVRFSHEVWSLVNIHIIEQCLVEPPLDGTPAWKPLPQELKKENRKC